MKIGKVKALSLETVDTGVYVLYVILGGAAAAAAAAADWIPKTK